jgi:glutamate/tyrosine decarboxylase-like PLP-dependent enzyme
MSSLALLQSLKESILSQANVKAIYCEPIAAHGKTVIPVAKKLVDIARLCREEQIWLHVDACYGAQRCCLNR